MPTIKGEDLENLISSLLHPCCTDFGLQLIQRNFSILIWICFFPYRDLQTEGRLVGWNPPHSTTASH